MCDKNFWSQKCRNCTSFTIINHTHTHCQNFVLMYVFIIILSLSLKYPILKINSKGLKYPLERKWNSKVETIQTLNCNAFEFNRNIFKSKYIRFKCTSNIVHLTYKMLYCHLYPQYQVYQSLVDKILILLITHIHKNYQYSFLSLTVI